MVFASSAVPNSAAWTVVTPKSKPTAAKVAAESCLITYVPFPQKYRKHPVRVPLATGKLSQGTTPYRYGLGVGTLHEQELSDGAKGNRSRANPQIPNLIQSHQRTLRK